jgi:NADP-dependent 3-hydroxy acid dehydrogenase YdfG
MLAMSRTAAAVDQSASRLAKEYDGPDIFANSAGVAIVESIEQFHDTTRFSAMETSLNGTRPMVRAALPGVCGASDEI